MDHLRNLIPTSKVDIERAAAAVEAGYPEVAPILGELIGWLQDYNWPVAHVLAPFLASIGAPLVPHVWHVLLTDDGVWKYWVIGMLIRALRTPLLLSFVWSSSGFVICRGRTRGWKSLIRKLEMCSSTSVGFESE
jgi:hypothetical protein